MSPLRLLPALLLLPLLVACPPTPVADDDDDDDDSAGGTISDRMLTAQTTLGDFGIELLPDEAPVTAGNFLQYVDEGFYDGSDGLGATIFHRVIPDFMAQGGGFTADGVQKSTRAPIANEASSSGLSNLRGTLSMARTSAPNSATSQFFINVVDNAFLDAGGSTPDGYAVFGRVTFGMDVVDQIVAVPRDGTDWPDEDIVITSLTRDED